MDCQHPGPSRESVVKTSAFYVRYSYTWNLALPSRLALVRDTHRLYPFIEHCAFQWAVWVADANWPGSPGWRKWYRRYSAGAQSDKAKWHISCHKEVSVSRKEEVIQGRYNYSDPEYTIPRKYTNRSGSHWGGGGGGCENVALHEASMFHLDDRVRNCSLILQDEQLLLEIWLHRKPRMFDHTVQQSCTRGRLQMSAMLLLCWHTLMNSSIQAGRSL
jgi:hypothetical protein